MLVVMAISVDELRLLVAQARAQAEAAGELDPTGPTQVELPPSVRESIAEALRSGAYEQAARESTAGDADMTQL
jgi:hypothetical protein